MQWKTRPLGYFSYTVLCCLCKRGDGRAAREGGEHHLFQFTPLREGRPALQAAAGSHLGFQFTPLREGRLQGGPGAPCGPDFNSRPCERGDPGCACLMSSSSNFNSRPCERGDRFGFLRSAAVMDFNSRPCERGDRAMWAVRSSKAYFNSRPCERGDQQLRLAAVAPLFQFTPLREGRLQGGPGAPCGPDFNSRPCERGDDLIHIDDTPTAISIHAPARGATRQPRSARHRPAISIHAPARGATQSETRRIISLGFQFTPLREGRPRKISKHFRARDFNSRPCERGDSCTSLALRMLLYFNSRPCERGDGCIGRLCRFGSISIHAPARGATTFQIS